MASDRIKQLKKYKVENKINIDIISDRGAKIAQLYDVYMYTNGAEKNIKIKQAYPSKFLINKNRVIKWTYIGKEKTDRPSIQNMIDAIES